MVMAEEIEDKYCDRVKEINDIDEEIRWLGPEYVERVEKAFNWISNDTSARGGYYVI